MNWLAFWQVIACCAIASVIAGISIWLIERGVHVAWIVLGIFIGAAVFAGVTTP